MCMKAYGRIAAARVYFGSHPKSRNVWMHSCIYYVYKYIIYSSYMTYLLLQHTHIIYIYVIKKSKKLLLHRQVLCPEKYFCFRILIIYFIHAENVRILNRYLFNVTLYKTFVTY